MGSEKRKVKQTENVLNCKFVDASYEENDTERWRPESSIS